MLIAPAANANTRYLASTAGVLLLATVSALLVALGVAVGLRPAALVIAALPAAVLAYAVLAPASVRPVWLADGVFLLAFALSLALPQIQALTGRSYGFALELLFVFVAPLTVSLAFRLLKESPFFRVWGAIFLVYLGISILSSLLGRSTVVAGVYQFLTNLKLLILILFGFLIAWMPQTERAFWLLVRWLWLPNLVLITWQLSSPGSFFAVYEYANKGVDPFGLLPSIGVGFFFHQSYLGAFAATMSLICFARATFSGGRMYWVHGAMHFVALLLSVQRAEVVTVFALVVLLLLLRGRKALLPFKTLILAAALVAAASAAWMFAHENLEKEASIWGVQGYEKIWHPRPLMYYHSASLADKHFPLGIGLGTFGSAGAKLFDQSLYYELGFARFPWFYSSRTVLMDTYWPNFFAESGWIGGTVMLFLVLALIGYAGVRAVTDEVERARLYWWISFLGLAMLFSISWTANSFQDPAVMLLPCIAFGLAYRMARRANWRNLS